MATLGYLLWLIYEIDSHDCLATLSDADIPDIDILIDSSTAGVCLYSYDTVKIRGVHVAILSEHISHATRYL